MDRVHRDKQLEKDIKEHGLQVMYVLGDEDGPGFGYSIGLYKTYGHAEIIIIGLKQESTHILINNMAFDIKKGKEFVPQLFDDSILDNFNCYIISVDKSNYDEYVAQAQRFYNGSDFPLIQCIYPTVKGIFPWEDEWPDEIKDLQPILGSINSNP